MRARFALVGREDVAAVLDRAWSRAQRELAVVTVRGAPGIGKTTIVADAVRRHGAAAFFTGGISGVGAAAMETLMPWLDQAALSGRAAPDIPTARALAALFADVARETGRVVAVIDDVQWADVDSVRMIAAALRVLRASGAAIAHRPDRAATRRSGRCRAVAPVRRRACRGGVAAAVRRCRYRAGPRRSRRYES
ncbi:ATP-binding protein [Nocardia sp. NPDC050710]|uniref:ATP-binding protein n=1 Tax=Nocardia sp. NPDC050710 TaxID=3157220 RepID=UPI0033C8B7AB